MSSLSSRCKLILLTDNDIVDPSPIDQNSNAIDGFASVLRTVSGSRPATLFDGQWIYDGDTQTVRRWNAAQSKAQMYGGVNGNNGLVNTFSNTAAALINGAGGVTDISLMDYQATLLNGHSYKIVEQGYVSLAGPYTPMSAKILSFNWRTNLGLGSPPPLSDGAAIHTYNFGYDYRKLGCAIPFYKVMHAVLPGAIGTGTTVAYFKSIFSTDPTQFAATQHAGHPSDSTVPIRAWIYDQGPVGSN